MASFEHMKIKFRSLLPIVCVVTLAGATLLSGCGGGGGSAGRTNGTGNNVIDSTTTLTGSIFCPHTASVFNAGLNLTSTVSMICDSSVRVMTANGIPDHVAGTFPNANNPSTITVQAVSFITSLNPAIASSTGTAVAHVVGFANNGIKFDPATAESYQNAGTWNIEALGQTFMALGIDASNAHVQPNGSYHYHGMPEGYINLVNPGQSAKMTLVGFANDGFPIYARWGYATATDATTAVKVMSSSYQLKSTASVGRPSSDLVPMGVFTQDYEYVAGLGDLDECNGRYGVTPEFPSGIYHYYITDSYPYIQRCIKGTSLI